MKLPWQSKRTRMLQLQQKRILAYPWAYEVNGSFSWEGSKQNGCLNTSLFSLLPLSGLLPTLPFAGWDRMPMTIGNVLALACGTDQRNCSPPAADPPAAGHMMGFA